MEDEDSTDRKTGDYILFGLGSVGILLGLGGVIVSSPSLALTGAVLFLLTVLIFQARPAPRQ